MHADYRKQKNREEAWTMRAGEITLRVTRIVHGKLYALHMESDGRKADVYYDGSAAWAVNHAERTFAKVPGSNPEFTRQFEPLTTEPGSSRFDFVPYGFAIGVYPTPKVSSVQAVQLSGHNARLLTASARDSQGRARPFKLWFERDAWLLLRFEMPATGADGSMFTVTGESKITRRTKVQAADVRPPALVLQSYQERTEPLTTSSSAHYSRWRPLSRAASN